MKRIYDKYNREIHDGDKVAIPPHMGLEGDIESIEVVKRCGDVLLPFDRIDPKVCWVVKNEEA